MHQDGITRLHGKFINADLPEDAKLSILLPRQDHFSTPWPASKVIRTTAFTDTGLDYFGPLHMRQVKTK